MNLAKIEKIYLAASVQAINQGSISAKKLALKIRDEWELVRDFINHGMSERIAVETVAGVQSIIAHKIKF